jgi:hypothetical protein
VKLAFLLSCGESCCSTKVANKVKKGPTIIASLDASSSSNDHYPHNGVIEIAGDVFYETALMFQ